METLLATDPERHGYMKGLNSIQRYLAKRRYAWEDRHPVGRTIYEGGYIKIQPDVYHPKFIERLLHVCCSMDFMEQQKSGFEQPVPRALRPAGQKRPGGAFLGRGLANPFGRTKKRIAMYFCNALFVLMLFGFRIILAAYHLPHRCTVLLPAVHFSADL
mgnify:CR=1 FL=1